MSFELPKKIREEIRWKYASLDENGKKKYTVRELGKEYGCRRQYISTIHQANPETGKKFKSESEYNNYIIKQKTNPETDKEFESKTEYQSYNSRQLTNPETGENFKSEYEYRKQLAKQKDLETIVEE